MISSPAGSTATLSYGSSVHPEFFADLAKDWWNPKGKMASLHQVNPVRLGFVREGTWRECWQRPAGDWVDCAFLAILRREWAARR